MRLVSARVASVGPFGDLTFRFTDDEGAARPSVVVLGGSGTGKTSLLSAIAQTRPGLSVAIPRARGANKSATPFAVTEWQLGQDEPSRPHPLSIASPNAVLGDDEATVLFRRREQAAFDRKTAESSFALTVISGARWFSRTPNMLTTPDRSLLRYDVRSVPSFDDATRADLTRETKQALSFGEIAMRLEQDRGETHFARLANAMRDAVTKLTSLAGYRFAGVDAATLEPLFESEAGDFVPFDDLPTSVRHLASFAALAVKTVFAARPNLAPRAAECVVLIDEIALHQDPRVVPRILPALRAALPAVQWIVTTASPLVAQDADDGAVLAIRRMSSTSPVELYDGPLALVH